MTSLHWDTGTAYDFFISLYVLHHPAAFGLRPLWAAGVRQRLSTPKRELLERVYSFTTVPLNWLNRLAEPKDAAALLGSLTDLPPASRIPALTLPADTPAEARHTLEEIAARGSWSTREKDRLALHLAPRSKNWKPSGLENLLGAWSAAAEYGEMLLPALQEYQTAFFAEEETRLRPALAKGLAHARELAERLSPDALVEELSRGVRFEGIGTGGEMVLVPSYWCTPFVFHARLRPGKTLVVFGCRPEVESVAPGAGMSDPLVGALKALGDPTRLRLLRYLAREPLSPAELARRLRLRPPTVIHHLRTLRLAGLVAVRVDEQNERRYTARPEALAGILGSVQEFLFERD